MIFGRCLLFTISVVCVWVFITCLCFHYALRFDYPHSHIHTHTNTLTHALTHTVYLITTRVFMSAALGAGLCAWLVCILALVQRKARWLFVSAIVYTVQGKLNRYIAIKRLLYIVYVMPSSPLFGYC